MGCDTELGLKSVSPVERLQRSVTREFSRFHSIWPVALLGSVVIVTVVWIGFLGWVAVMAIICGRRELTVGV